MKKILRVLPSVIFIAIIGIYFYSYNAAKANISDSIIAKVPDNNIETGEIVKDDDVSDLEDSGIEGTSFVPNSNYYPYYEMLSHNEKKLYEQIYENSINMKTTFIPHTIASKEEVSNAVISVFNDHPELFWLNTSYSFKYLKNGTIVQITLNFNETAKEIDNAKELFNEKTNNIISEASKLESDYDKEKYVHDLLINNITYDKESLLNQSAYSAIVNNKSVCAGYARAFQYIMTKLGISTYYVMGSSNGDHAWNIINIDGNYYNVDITWDDNTNNMYAYFNVSDNDIAKSHTRKGLSVYLPNCSSSYDKIEVTEEVINNDVSAPEEETIEDTGLIVTINETDAF